MIIKDLIIIFKCLGSRHGTANNSSLANHGYRLILQGFSRFLEGAEQEQIIKQIKVLDKIQENVKYVLAKGLFEHGQQELQVDIIVQSLMSTFRTEGEIYIDTGTFGKKDAPGHACFCKFVKRGEQYYRIDYNAGQGAELGGPVGIVWSVNTRAILCSSDKEGLDAVEAMIRATLNRQMSLYPEFETEKNLIQRHCSSTIPELSMQTPTQGKGNCTTRSIREMLRGNLSSELFQRLQDYLKKPPEEIYRDQQGSQLSNLAPAF